MKTVTYKRIRMAILLFVLPFFAFTTSAQEKERERIEEALSTFQALSDRVQIKDIKNKTHPDSTRFVGATIGILGHDTRVDFEFHDGKKKRVKVVNIEFPEAAKITSEDFRALFGQSFDELMPPGVGVGVGIRTLRVAFEDQRKNKVDEVLAVLRFGTWMPFDGMEEVSLVDLEGMFAMSGMATKNKEFQVGISAYFFLPKNLASYLGIGQTKLRMSGSINTKTKEFSIQADLNSRSIPILEDESLILQRAKLEFAFTRGRPCLAIGGTVSVQEDGTPIMPPLSGELSIDVTGRIYGEAWMDQSGGWKNPLGLSPNVSITKMGFGFGANFNTPVPTPIMAIEGGIDVRSNPNDAQPRFSGSATVGIDLGDPTRNMIDAQIPRAFLSDIVDAFYPAGANSPFVNELRKIDVTNLHLTIVPPGDGAELFNIKYNPGFYAEGAIRYGNNRGAIFIDIDEHGVEGFAGITDIIYPGFKITGVDPGKGPYMFLAMKPLSKKMGLAISGNVEVMGISRKTDVYLSDRGFNVVMEGNIFGEFGAKLDVAGGDLLKGESIYLKAEFDDQDNLVQKITKEASAHLNKLADEVAAEHQKNKAQLEALRPQMDQAKTSLEAKQVVVRKRWEGWCELLNQREAQDAERKRKEAEISQLRNEIATMERNLTNDRYRRANELNPTVCDGNSKPFNDYCYSPKSGYEWDIAQPINGNMATFKPESRTYADPIPQGNFDVFAGCPSGQFGDAITGKCYSCPSGYQKDGLATKCVKITPIDHEPAVKGQYIGCGSNGSFADIGMGKCYSCPSGYERKASLEPITSNKACELINLSARESAINDKKIQLGALETELTVITNGLGELATKLSGASSTACQDLKDTDAINADPEVAPLFTTWSGLSLQVNELQKLIDDVEKTQVGALRASAYMIEQGGKTLEIVDIDFAKFEGCANTVSGGMVALEVKGQFAGQPLDASFKIDLKNPESYIRDFANQLLGNSNPKTTYSNGTCTRPLVPKPAIENENIEELMEFVNKNTQPSLPERPTRMVRPDWAPEQRFGSKRKR
ncbi:MAG: hypothetical protein NXI10_09500 [bacterium]|nr:hypothetical protein [bacterium]